METKAPVEADESEDNAPPPALPPRRPTANEAKPPSGKTGAMDPALATSGKAVSAEQQAGPTVTEHSPPTRAFPDTLQEDNESDEHEHEHEHGHSGIQMIDND